MFMLSLERSFEKSPHSRGYSLIEVVVSMGISLMVMMLISSVFALYAKQMAGLKGHSSRADIVRTIRLAGQDIRSYRASVSFTPGLEDCLNFNPDVSPNCLSKSGQSYYKHPIHLVFFADSDRPVAGPAEQVGEMSPVYYDSNGRLCEEDEAPEVCPLQAVVSYTPHCRDGDDSCSGAQILVLDYSVRIRPDLSLMNTNLGVFRPDIGKVFLVLDQGNYLRIQDAFSSVGGFISEVEMAEGKSLPADVGSRVRLTIAVRDDELPERILIKGHVLDESCDFETFGVAPCERPAYSDYALLEEIQTSDGSVMAQYSVAFTVMQSGMMEVVALGEYDGEVRRRSSTVLRLVTPSIPVVYVTGPEILTYSCSGSNHYTFTFMAYDPAGIFNFEERIAPSIMESSFGLPSFNFDPTNPNPQDYTIHYDEFNEGLNHQMTFKVENNLMKSDSDTHNFYVEPKAKPQLSITSPISGSFLRSIDQLHARAVVDLACGDTLNDFTFGVERSGEVLMSDQPVSCLPLTGQPDHRNAYVCEQVFSCNQWLGDTPECSEFTLSGEETFTLVARASSEQVNSPPQIAMRNFTVGAKVSAVLELGDKGINTSRKFLNVRNYHTAPTADLVINFSAPLPAEARFEYSSVPLEAGPSGEFTVSAGSTTHTLSIPVPESNVVVTFTTTTGGANSSDDFVLWLPNQNYAEFVWIERFAQGCASQVPSAVTCGAGIDPVQQITQIGVNDNLFNTPSTALEFSVDMLSGSNVDFLLLHKRSSSTGPQMARQGITFIRSEPYMLITLEQKNEPTDILPKAFYIDTTYWDQYKTEGSVLTGNANVKVSGARYDAVYLRQCYCPE